MSHRTSCFQLNDLFPREIDIEVCLKTLKIFQKLEGDVNCVVWDASLVLAKYLETMCQHKADFLSGIKVLELGSGLGVVGLTAATLGAQVTLTDLPEALPLLRLNISENKQKIVSMGGYAIAESLVWGDKNSEIHKQEFDMIVLADCVYYEDAIDPLIETLQCLNNTINKKPTIYLTQELRDSDIQKKLWDVFYEKLTEFFYIEKIPEEQQHVNYRSSDILLLKIIKK
ncbi:protein N-lysine methyltransferase METTL21D-like isoform X1 [Vanessa tameamea]|uniref:Protein N-lysine methyltransferase METTL21D-like isoform X1 n=1 Tax=Vanessa tameamea TaxID=334116 RepID=A0A8B8HLE9_VANTA|nr:protein-lysine methyltransferase METTL21D-like isoform X1 [Vanessa tameamea]